MAGGKDENCRMIFGAGKGFVAQNTLLSDCRLQRKILASIVTQYFSELRYFSARNFICATKPIVTVYFVGGVLFYILVRLSKYNEIPLDVAGQKICLFCWMVNKKFDIIRGNRETD